MVRNEASWFAGTTTESRSSVTVSINDPLASKYFTSTMMLVKHDEPGFFKCSEGCNELRPLWFVTSYVQRVRGYRKFP